MANFRVGVTIKVRVRVRVSIRVRVKVRVKGYRLGGRILVRGKVIVMVRI